MNQVERFWSKVQKTDGCWIWTASKRHKGYGAFCYSKNGVVVQGRAHRFMWEMVYGDIPAGMFVLHRCDNPACVNPDHLWLGTNQDNVDDMMRKGRHVSGGTYCKRTDSGKWKKGKCHWNYRMSDEKISEIRSDRKNGLSYGLISKKHSISIGYAFRLCNNQARKEVGFGSH
jgi:hypothetical protein